MKKNEFKVTSQDEGKRLDIFLSENLAISRNQAQKLVKEGLVFLNANLVDKPSAKITFGNTIKVTEPDKKKIENRTLKGGKKSKFNFPEVKILADTSDYLVVNKPSGLLTHPTPAQESVSLMNWAVANYPEIKGVGGRMERSGIVHRLDKGASGVLVLAKNQVMLNSLKKQFQNRLTEKEYVVLVHGVVESNHGLIDFDIDRGKDGRMVSRPKTNKLSLRTVSKIQPGKESLTEFSVEKRFARYTLLRVRIHTGRTHQIRVHMLAYNHPVVGDDIYFNKKLNTNRDKKLGRIFLHSARLCFNDLQGKKVCFDADLPVELKNVLQELK